MSRYRIVSNGEVRLFDTLEQANVVAGEVFRLTGVVLGIEDVNEMRRRNADQAFALYDMGDMEVKDTGTWQQDGDEWSMPVYVENGDEPSIKLTFVVRFLAGSAEVNEAYFAH